MDKVEVQKIENLLLKYKYDNFPLESIVVRIFEQLGVRSNSLYDEVHIDLIKEFTYELVDYKFNCSRFSRRGVIEFIDNWCFQNKDILRVPTVQNNLFSFIV